MRKLMALALLATCAACSSKDSPQTPPDRQARQSVAQEKGNNNSHVAAVFLESIEKRIDSLSQQESIALDITDDTVSAHRRVLETEERMRKELDEAFGGLPEAKQQRILELIKRLDAREKNSGKILPDLNPNEEVSEFWWLYNSNIPPGRRSQLRDYAKTCGFHGFDNGYEMNQWEFSLTIAKEGADIADKLLKSQQKANRLIAERNKVQAQLRKLRDDIKTYTVKSAAP